MNIEFTGRGVDILPALRDLATEKLDKIKRHSLPIDRVKVIFTVEKHSHHSVEANLHVSGIDLNARAEDVDMYRALDLMIDKLDIQVKKYKDKMKHHR
ncbi:MAG: sigma54 modulation protein/ribosomal protein [Gammaproteobacteria bacterium]|jgi:putative sigma-54 modulation protein|nr:sigma54 modulation protein/ribosomal protein [Gammaproteobacteria bacterium]